MATKIRTDLRLLKYGLIAISSVAAVAAAVLYCFALMLKEDVEFRVGQLAYYILVAPYGTLRDFPIYAATPTDVRYEYDAADGPAPARLTMTVHSPASAPSILDRYAEYCALRDSEIIADTVQCETSDYSIAIIATELQDGARLIITFEEK